MNVGRYTRKPLHVQAIQVTSENMGDVAKWCNGQLTKQVLPTFSKEAEGREAQPQECIKVPVVRPLNHRLGYAFVGDYVVKSSSNFRVYLEKIFNNTFYDQNSTP